MMFVQLSDAEFFPFADNMHRWYPLLWLIICATIRCQYSLYNTERPSAEGQDYDCLHYFVPDTMLSLVESFQHTYEMITYCRRPDSLIITNVDLEHGARVPFEQLREHSVSSADLLAWKAPIDLIESYQIYLNNPHKVSSGQVYHNCSALWFGQHCQYTFGSNLTFSEIVEGVFLAKSTSPGVKNQSSLQFTNLTCYAHLNCYRGISPVCLDWREVCDGKVDCLYGGADERDCFDHPCAIDEYRCQNGLCIPTSFIHDDPIDPDCTDGTDEIEISIDKNDNPCYQDPAFRCEEHDRSSWNTFVCGDGQTTVDAVPSLQFYCYNRRDELLVNALFSYSNHPNLSRPCWSAVSCLLSMDHMVEELLCKQPINYVSNVQASCPAYFLFPNGPVHLGHIYFVYSSNRSHLGSSIQPDFVCDDGQLICNSSIVDPSTFVFNGSPFHCRYVQKIPQFRSNCSSWDDLIKDTENWTRSACAVPTTTFADIIKEDKPSIIGVSFSKICNGYVDLINSEHNMTDESDCDQWQCDNLYTRCDQFWDCPNGADEANCSSSLCPPNQHPCVSPLTYEFTCLPLSQANNGIIDCVGSSDERAHCRELLPENKVLRYRCHNSTDCIHFLMFCHGLMSCPSDNQTELCTNTKGQWTRCKDTWQVLYQLADRGYSSKPIYFTLDHYWEKKSAEEHELIPCCDKKTRNSSYRISLREAWLCNRGIPVYMDPEKRHMHCLCSKSYYGDRCQYQNQRVSLTVQFQKATTPTVWHEIFHIVVFLLSDDDQQGIETYEQFNYASINRCSHKHNIHLLYRSRPKHINVSYSVRIDAFAMNSFIYHSSWYMPISFAPLPVSRLVAQLKIPVEADTTRANGCQPPCSTHGQCLRFTNMDQYFCRCDRGWSGKQCTIAYNCSCSSDSFCIGSSNNRSICVCPLSKFGPRCLLNRSVCQLNRCDHGGLCVPKDERVAEQGYTCLCENGFSGVHCEIPDVQIHVTFVNMPIPMSLLVHLITVFQSSNPTRMTIFKKIGIDENTVTLFIPTVFHMIFVEMNRHLYLIGVQSNYTFSAIISTQLTPSRRCPSVNNLFNTTVLAWSRLRRVKYYHKPCQDRIDLSCFHDDIYLCLCTEDRRANCFEFDHNMTYNCHGDDYCENKSPCFQDHPRCPTIRLCMCPECYYGSKCQFSTDGIGLSLDAIFGYEIQPQKQFHHQRTSVIVSALITMIMLIGGLINGILSLLTFYRKSPQEVGCGVYLLSSSMSSLLTMILFSFKFWFLVLFQMGTITNRTFIVLQCLSVDFLTRSFLTWGNWLDTCVSIERTIAVIKGVHFDKKRSKQVAKWVIFALLICILATLIQDPIHRQIIDDFDEKRTWCIVTYPAHLAFYNSVVISLHLLITFLINITSTIIIIISISRRRASISTRQTYKKHLQEQSAVHKHIIIAPCVLVLFALPRVILSFISGCMKSARNPWLFLFGYYVSFIPPLLVFPVFVLPSKMYRIQLTQSIKVVRKKFQKSVQRC